MRSRQIAICAATMMAGTLNAADSGELLRQARTALDEHLPQIALSKLEAVAAQGNLRPEAAAELDYLKAEAQLSNGQPDAALTTLAGRAKNVEDVRAALLSAHALAKAGRWSEARPIYTRLAARPDAGLSAKVGLAESLQALGETAKAIKVLEGIGAKSSTNVIRLRLASLYAENEQGGKARQTLSSLKPSNPEERLWARYIEGRLYLLELQPAAARSVFTEVLTATSHLNENLFVAATLGAAQAKIALQGNEAADNELETFIWRHPESAWLELMFRRLDQIYAGEGNAAESELQKWAKKPQLRRAALAQYYVARMQIRARKWDKALASLDTFVRNFTGHTLIHSVQLMRADVLIEKGDLNAAVSALEAAARVAGDDGDLRAEIELRTGLVQYRQREYLLAATSLDRAAERPGPASAIARYDAALAWLNQTNFERFQEEYQRLNERGATGELRGNLMLEEGLLRARMRDPAARETLRRFVDQFPSHPRLAEARLADAELSLAANRPGEATQLLRVVNEKPRSGEVDDHAAYLAVFLADAKKPRTDAEVVGLAKDFLRTKPKSPLVPEIRMKLGQVYFRQPDYPNAETQFALLAKETPQSAYAETALFLAGQSAMRTINTGSTERALGYLDEVVKRNGPLKLHAREQQAIIQVSLGKEAEAIALYDLILESKQPVADPDLRAAAYIGKGDALLRKGGAEAEAAIGVFAEIASVSGISPMWRNQAIYKKGKALDQLGRRNEAIAGFNEVLDLNQSSKDREFFWYYKAGFEAARYYEDASAWPSAIAIYEKIARVEGPSASEAKTRANKLRVEHFIWD